MDMTYMEYLKMSKNGNTRKLILVMCCVSMLVLSLAYVLLGWIWVPRYRTRFSNAKDFSYKIAMSCHDTEYEYCNDLRYVYERHGWSKSGGYIRYIDNQAHYNNEKRKYIEAFQNNVETYSIINDEYKEQYNCEDIFSYNNKSDGIDQEYLNKNGIDSKLIDKILNNERLNEYDLLCSYMYNSNVEVPGKGSEENYFCVLYNDNTMSLIVFRRHKIIPD